MLDTLPDEKRKCHRCSFDKSCRELVLSGACQRWKRYEMKQHPLEGETHKEWNCIDDHMFVATVVTGLQTFSATVEMNELRNEFKTSHDANVTMGAIAVQRSRDAVKNATAEAVQPLIDAVRGSLRDVAEAVSIRNPEPQKLLSN